MKITDVKTIPIAVRLEKPLVWATGTTHERNTTLVQVVTDSCITGIGEAAGPPKIISAIIEMLKTRIMNENPLDIEKLWRNMWGRRSGQFADMIISAISGIDIALWDIAGKKTGLPVTSLLGGFCRDKVKAYATGGYFKPVGELAKEVYGYAEQGFKAVKIKVGLGIDKDLEIVKTVRKAVGYDFELMVDANEAYDAPTAIKLARKLSRYDIGWFEEPVHSRDVESLAKISSKVDIPIAAGEYEHTRFGFREMISRKAVDIIQPDVTIAGGLTECRKIAAMAEAWNIGCAPHVWGSAVGLAAAVHLIASTSNCIILELDRTYNPLRENLAKDQIICENGYVKVPKEPGLGIDLDQDVLKRYSEVARKEADLYDTMNP
jgi:D-galactarolactone cycloisomerase